MTPIRHYDRRPRTGIMLAHPFEEKRLLKWGLPYISQIKYDGERALAFCTPSGTGLVSSTGLPIENLPHITEALKALPLGVYDGELYIHGARELVGSIRRTVGEHAEGKKATYVIFDIKTAEPQIVRITTLATLRSLVDPAIIQIAPYWLVSAMAEVEEILADSMARGYEGVVLREPFAVYSEKRVYTMLKIKPRSSDTYRIIGTVEEHSINDEPKGRLGAFIVTDQDGKEFQVGSGLTAAQREKYWKLRNALTGAYILIKYQCLTANGIPYAPIFVEVMR